MTTDQAADQAKAVFDQNFQQYRMLNEQLNRIPPLAVTLTGGFWYIAVVIENYGPLTAGMENLARFSLMSFCGFCNLMLILVAFRVRDVMRAYIKPLSGYAGGGWPDTDKGGLPWLGANSMIGIYCALMLAGALLSIAGGWILFWPAADQPLAVGIGGSLLGLVGLIGSSALLARLGPR